MLLAVKGWATSDSRVKVLVTAEIVHIKFQNLTCPICRLIED
jgi:hypothetical protein